MSYSVFIIDDEKHICNLIKNEIDWDRLGLSLCGMSDNSANAMEIILASHPDIIITDIQMPGISGLELIEQIQAHDFNPHFIIISGYSYFDYAKQAVKFGVENYLLKPIDHDELNETLERICKKLNRTTIQADSLVREKMDTASLRDYFIVNPTDTRSADIPTINSDYHFHFHDGVFYAICLKIDQHRIVERAPITSSRLLRSLTRNIASSSYDFHIVANDPLSYIGLLNCEETAYPAILRGLQYVIDECNSDFLLGNDSYLTIGISEAFRELSKKAFYMEHAKALCDTRLVCGTNRVYEYNEGYERPTDFAEAASSFKDAVNSAVNKLDRELFTDACSQYLDRSFELIKSCPLSISKIEKTFTLFITSALNTFEEASISYSDYDTFAAYKKALITDAVQKFNVYESGFISNERKIVMEIKAYIRAHLSEKLDLDSLSKVFYLSSGYLGQLFKSETGLNITAFINDERIEASKELLLNKENSISDVAEATGYNDAKYFTRMFKRSTGISPLEYRKIHRIS